MEVRAECAPSFMPNGEGLPYGPVPGCLAETVGGRGGEKADIASDRWGVVPAIAPICCWTYDDIGFILQKARVKQIARSRVR